MTRTARVGRRLPWAGVAALLLTACGTGTPDGGPDEDPALARLRAAAAVSACPPGVGTALPDLTLPCLSGGPDVPLAAPGSGRPTLVNVWAAWCSPCVREVPELVDLARTGRVDVVGVLTQDTARNGLELARQLGMRYPSVVDDGGVVMRAFSPGPPVTLFFDAEGRVRHVQRGEIRSSETLRALVRQHLGTALIAGGET